MTQKVFYYVTLDATDVVYSVHRVSASKLPLGAIEITQQEFQTISAGSVFHRENGEFKPFIANDAINCTKSDFKADGKDEVIISGIQKGVYLTLSGIKNVGPVLIEDGQVVLTSNKFGPIHCYFSGIKGFFPKRITVNAV